MCAGAHVSNTFPLLLYAGKILAVLRIIDWFRTNDIIFSSEFVTKIRLCFTIPARPFEAMPSPGSGPAVVAAADPLFRDAVAQPPAHAVLPTLRGGVVTAVAQHWRPWGKGQTQNSGQGKVLTLSDVSACALRVQAEPAFFLNEKGWSGELWGCTPTGFHVFFL